MQDLEENLTKNLSRACGRNSTHSMISFVEPEYRKGSFNSKYSDQDSKAAAFVVENIKVIDRTINAVSHLFTDHTFEIHKNSELLSISHLISAIYDFNHGTNKFSSIMSPVMFITNAHTDFFSSQQNIGLKCTMEGAYALLRGFPSIPSLISPSAELVGATINFSLCMNAELNTSKSKVFIDKGLKIFKALLQAKNPIALSLVEFKDPIGTLIETIKAGNLFEWLGLKESTSIVKTIAYTKAYWHFYDFAAEASDIISGPSNINKLDAVGTTNDPDEL